VVLPAQADPACGQISVFAPLGTALLGYRLGLKIEAVMQSEQSPDGTPPQRKEGLAA
jgi:transcription elongation GreA/GreB family factor